MFPSPSKHSEAWQVVAVKRDDKNVYRGTAIKERVSESNVSITQNPLLLITRATAETLNSLISLK